MRVIQHGRSSLSTRVKKAVRGRTALQSALRRETGHGLPFAAAAALECVRVLAPLSTRAACPNTIPSTILIRTYEHPIGTSHSQ